MAQPLAQPFRARLSSRTTIARGVVDLVFDLVDLPALVFNAGQFVSLAVGRDQNGRDIRRSFSIASRSDQGQSLRFIVKIVPGGPASEYFMRLSLGATVEMTGPHGFFQLVEQHPGDVVFAATGTGLAAVLPMLAELAERPEPGRLMLYWGLRAEEDLFRADEAAAACAAAGAEFHTYLSRPSDAWRGLRGRITAPILDRYPSLHAPTFYLVGNGAMIEELKKALVARGVDRKRHIRTEAFFD
jgi:CDP-4-dehydro-6-deoxyglucose reductase